MLSRLLKNTMLPPNHPAYRSHLERSYYDAILQKAKEYLNSEGIKFTYSKKRAFVLVCQALPDAEEYIKTFMEMGEVVAIIPKRSKELRPDIIRKWKEDLHWPVCDKISAEDLKNPADAIAFLGDKLKGRDFNEFAIVDHSAYFGPAMDAIAEHFGTNRKTDRRPNASGGFKPICKAVIDGTADGLHIVEANPPQKLRYFTHYDSGAKEQEAEYTASDTLIAVDEILTRIGEGGLIGKRRDHPTHAIHTIGVIGLGKTGKAMVDVLRTHLTHFHDGIRFPNGKSSSVQDIIIYDKDKGKHFGFIGTEIRDKDADHDRLSDCDLVFCCTGDGALDEDDIPKLKDGVYLATITSPDRELGLKKKIASGDLQELPRDQRKYTRKVPGGNNVYLCTPFANGNKHINLLLADPKRRDLLLGFPPNYLVPDQDPRMIHTHVHKIVNTIRALCFDEIRAIGMKDDEIGLDEDGKESKIIHYTDDYNEFDADIKKIPHDDSAYFSPARDTTTQGRIGHILNKTMLDGRG